jgi:hypothetical protein
MVIHFFNLSPKKGKVKQILGTSAGLKGKGNVDKTRTSNTILKYHSMLPVIARSIATKQSQWNSMVLEIASLRSQ